MIRDSAADKFAIRELIDNWVIWRDSGRWDALLEAWHADGRMVTTWCECSSREFVLMCQSAWTTGNITVVHSLGGTAIELARDRAVAQTRMTLVQRASLAGVRVDVTCTGRFYDLLEYRNGHWALVLRQPIYEMDRIDAVTPGVSLELDESKMLGFPEEYRYLAYLQSSMGVAVNRTLPGKSGPQLESVYAQGREWLSLNT